MLFVLLFFLGNFPSNISSLPAWCMQLMGKEMLTELLKAALPWGRTGGPGLAQGHLEVERGWPNLECTTRTELWRKRVF